MYPCSALTLAGRYRCVPCVVAIRRLPADSCALANEAIAAITGPANLAVQMPSCLTADGAMERWIWGAAVQSCTHTYTNTHRQTESKPHQLLNHHLEETPLLWAISACLLPCVREPSLGCLFWQSATTSQRMPGHNNMTNTRYLYILFNQHVPCRIYYSFQIFYSYLGILHFSPVIIQHK